MAKTRIQRRLDRPGTLLRPSLEALDDSRATRNWLMRFDAWWPLPEHYKLARRGGRGAEALDHYIERALTVSPDQVSWHDSTAFLRTPRRRLPGGGGHEAARGEVRSAQSRGARRLDSQCWKRALQPSVRVVGAWRPRNAAEQHLIDQMAQWQELIWGWLDTMTAYHQMTLNGSSGKDRMLIGLTLIVPYRGLVAWPEWTSPAQTGHIHA